MEKSPLGIMSSRIVSVLTQDEYDALPDTKTSDDVIYFISEKITTTEIPLVIKTEDSDWVGSSTVSIKVSNKNGEYTGTFDSSGECTISLTYLDTYTVEILNGTTILETTTITIDDDSKSYEVVVERYFQKWVASGGITKEYNSLDDVLADENTIAILFTKHDSVDFLCDWLSKDGSSSKATKIFSNNYVAKWVNKRDYALDKLSSNDTINTIMESVGKYFYGEWNLVSVLPTMTGASAPYGSAVASATMDGYDAYKAFDGDDSTYWYDGNVAANTDVTLTYTLQTYAQICQIDYTVSFNGGCSKCVLQASYDKTNWDTLDTLTDIPTGIQSYSTKFDEKTYISFRLVMTKADTTGIGVMSFQCYNWEPVGNVPTMTSNTAPSGVVSASTEYGSYLAYFAFNKSPSYWATTSSAYPAWIQYQFTNPVCMRRLMTYTTGTSGNAHIKDCEILGSNDGSTWTTVATLTMDNTPNVKLYATFDNDDYYLYYKLNITSGYASGMNNICIREVQFYGRELSVTNSYMTSNTAPSGKAFGSSVYSSSYDYYMAFDTSTSTAWANTGSETNPWLAYQFTKKIKVKQVRHMCVAAQTFKIGYSDDGTTWTELPTEYNGTTTTQSVFTISEDTDAHLYWRVYITVPKSTNNIKVLKFYGKDYSESVDLTVYSAAADTVYYKDGDSSVTLCTTDSTGKGTASLPIDLAVNGVTLYSTVAKDTEDVSKGYSKSFDNLMDNYTDCVVKVMPTYVAYWYGYFAGTLNTTPNVGNSLTSSQISYTQNTNSFYVALTSAGVGTGYYKITNLPTMTGMSKVRFLVDYISSSTGWFALWVPPYSEASSTLMPKWANYTSVSTATYFSYDLNTSTTFNSSGMGLEDSATGSTVKARYLAVWFE